MRDVLAINSAQARALPLSAQRLVNLFPEVQAPDAKSKLALFGTPGLATFVTVGTGPIRGLHTMAGLLYAVSGTELYKITAGGVATLLGSVQGTANVVMDANSAQQLAIVSDNKTYVATPSTLAEITDPEFAGASSVAMMDNYAVFTQADSARFFISALADATSFDSLDFATAEAAPDNLVRVIADHREVMLFGESTTEIWYNSGASPFPFERVTGAVMERGCAAKLSPAKADNAVFWLGDDKIAYRAHGYTPTRISTHPLEEAWGKYSTVSDAIGFTYSQRGHTFYALTFPTPGVTWVFDVATGLWHERMSGESGRWRANGCAVAFGNTYVGDATTGKIYRVDLDTYTEGGETIRRIAQGAPIHAETKRAFMSRVEVEFEAGIGLTTGQGSDPQAMLQWADDGGRTWSSERWAAIGKIGEHRNRARWTRLGSFRERTLRLTVSDPVKVSIIAANVDVTGSIAA